MENSNGITTNEAYELSKLRINLLRAVFGLTFLSLGIRMWLYLISPDEIIKAFDGIAYSFWAAYATLMGVGIFLPKKMIPLIILQLFYKSVWLIFVFIPLWNADQIIVSESGLFRSSIIAVVIDLAIIPWKYVFKNYLKKDL